jgi:hypothetical protein
MVNPIILGFLMDELTPMWFCYLLLGESVMLFVLFIAALFLSKNNPTNDKINKVQYIVIILTGLQNLTRIIPINRQAEVLRVTGRIASLFLIGSSSGTMVNPIILGFLMDELTPMFISMTTSR